MKFKKDTNWLEQLKALDVDEAFIPKDLSQEKAEIIYHKLKLPTLIINRTWQLRVLLNDFSVIPLILQLTDILGNTAALDWIKSNQPNFLSSSEDFFLGNYIAHSAASYGNIPVLDWLKVNQPELLSRRDLFIGSIAHCAASCGHTAVLDWIKLNQPDLLLDGDFFTNNIAHCAASHGCTAVLDWIKTNQPDSLSIKDYSGSNIAHLAAKSINPETLKWVKNHMPDLLSIKNAKKLGIVHYAGMSKNPAQLILALSFTQDCTLNIAMLEGIEKKSVEKVIINALKQHHRLPVIIGASVSAREKIRQLQEKNRAMDEAVSNLKTLLGGNKDKSNSRILYKELWFEIFKSFLPKELINDTTLKEKISNIFNKVWSKMHVESRLENKKSFLKQELIKLIETEEKRLNSFFQRTFFNTGCIDEKKTVLAGLKELINTNEPFTEEVLKNWQKTNISTIKKQRNDVHSLFWPGHQTKTEQLIASICNETGFKISH